MPCVPIVDKNCNPVADLIEGTVQGMLDDLAQAMVETATWALKTLVTGWLATPSPLLDRSAVVDNLRIYTYWAVTALAVASLLYSATRLVLERNGRAATDMLTGLMKLVLVSSLTVPVVVALTEAGDSYATWIVDEAAGADVGVKVVELTAAASTSQVTSLALIGVAGIAILVALAQIVISIAVGGLKIVLTGVAPVAAAAGVSGGGRSTLARYLSWLGAALLFKPVAATVYAAAFWLLAADPSVEGTMTGLVVLSMAVLTLPALLRLLAPITAQVSGANGAGIAAAAVGGAATLATGAIRLSGGAGAARPAAGGPQAPAGASSPGAAPRPAQLPAGGGPQLPGGGGPQLPGGGAPARGGGDGPDPQGPQPLPSGPSGGPGGGPGPLPAPAALAAGAGAAQSVVRRVADTASGATPPSEGKQ